MMIRTLGAALLIGFFAALTGCMSIPGDDITLEDYPETKPLNGYEISYQLPEQKPWHLDYQNMEAAGLRLIDPEKAASQGCVLELNPTYDGEGTVCLAFNYLAFLTLYVLPYYCPIDYQLDATLVNSKGDLIETYNYSESADKLVSFFALTLDSTSKYFWSQAPERAKEKITEALIRELSNDQSALMACKLNRTATGPTIDLK